MSVLTASLLVGMLHATSPPKDWQYVFDIAMHEGSLSRT